LLPLCNRLINALPDPTLPELLISAQFPAEHADSFSWVGRSLFNGLLDNLPLELFAVGCCNCAARAAMSNRPEAKAMISPTLNRRLPPIRNPAAMVRRPVIQATRIKPITENRRQAHPQATSNRYH
jgi:hypothetical protein